jgi:hypothetical protein
MRAFYEESQIRKAAVAEARAILREERARERAAQRAAQPPTPKWRSRAQDKTRR